ncbi:NAD(P)H-hydrate dehydratase [Proteinivorax hydrogeniformans]|uniref:Bifunctional NAD(P)H-hydrate repair enzyme n=1 Tax=Proteinivorax hydrogeniformans TaxID=1826727 RepID=A0AAU8HSH3_9FIRM
MKLASAENIRFIDAKAESDYMISPLILMENAGRSITEKVIEIIPNDSSIAIFVGSGNNGGDGLVVARHLANKNFNVKVILCSDKLSQNAQKNLEILQNYNEIEVKFAKTLREIKEAVFCDFIIDALLGIGVDSEVSGFYKDAIEYVNSQKRGRVISIDTPSGLPACGPYPHWPMIKADYTITLEYPKENLMVYPHKKLAGKVYKVQIGLPNSLKKEVIPSSYQITSEFVKKILPKRKEDSHKGDYGTGIVLGGNPNMPGAVKLSSLAALKMGVGVLHTVVPTKIQQTLQNYTAENITWGIDYTNWQKSLNELAVPLEKSTAMAVGVGMGTQDNLNFFKKLIASYFKPIIIDGDGLNLLSKLSTKDIKENWILTPHPKEMARLTGLKLNEITKNPVEVAKYFSKEFNCTIVLKGASTVVSSPKGIAFVNISGNNGLSKGGSGDVLTGILLALVCNGATPLAAALSGVYIHGLSADLLVNGQDNRGVLPSEVAFALPKAIKEL